MENISLYNIVSSQTNKTMNILYTKLVEENKLVVQYSKGITNYSTDCGFDLYCPMELTVPAKAISFKIDLMIQTMLVDNKDINIGYMLIPRSSMGAKTPLRQCNSIGIIDPEYRGNLMMFVDNISDVDYNIKIGDRIGQIVSFNGNPIICRVVESLKTTERGEKGFGSTGR